MPVNESQRQGECLNIKSARYYFARVQKTQRERLWNRDSEGLHEDGHDLRKI